MTWNNKENMKNMFRLIHYVYGTNNLCVELDKMTTDKDIDWNLDFYVDSYWGSDPVNRKSVSGWIIMLEKNII